MTDMIVKLYDLEMPDRSAALSSQGVTIRRAMAFDKGAICNFVGDQFSQICPQWVDECALTLAQQPPTCFVAVCDHQPIGFCCWDASAKGMLGPIGVHTDFRKKGIAQELLRRTFISMREDGYAYTIIGWVSSTEFYQKTCNAIEIPGSFPGVYSRLLSQ